MITSKNALKHSIKNEASSNDFSLNQQSGAWQTVCDFCKQYDMQFEHGAGIVSVIKFIEDLIEFKKQHTNEN